METKEGWVTIYDIPTRFCCFGDGIDEKVKYNKSDPNNKKPIILFLTGNPGVIRFYYSFLQLISKILLVPVMALTHAGHENPSTGATSTEYDVTKVSTQVKHKAEFIRQFIDQDRDIYIIAHSFGSKITIELLKEEIFRKQIKKCYLLFPTLERIGDTRNAQKINFIIKYFFTIIMVSSFIFSVLPQAVKWWLVKLYFTICGRSKVDSNCISAAVELINPTTLGNVFNLASNEMDEIRQLDTEVIRECSDKIKTYFGKDDGWAPLEYHYNLLKEVPKVESTILENHEHDFVLDSAPELAIQLCEVIKKDINSSVM